MTNKDPTQEQDAEQSAPTPSSVQKALPAVPAVQPAVPAVPSSGPQMQTGEQMAPNEGGGSTIPNCKIQVQRVL